MSPPTRLEHATERLDAPAHDPAELRRSLDQIAGVNRWLGGRRALLRHLSTLLPPDGNAGILDVGTASADLPVAIAAWARRTRRSVHVTATDVHPQMVAIARDRTATEPAVDVEEADALHLPHPDDAFDVALLSLTLHHFDDRDAVRVLSELDRVARRGILVGELNRTWPNYLGARLLAATLWRGNRLTRHDGPMSVLRAYTPDELLDLARAAGLPAPRVHRHAFYRLVLRAGSPAPDRAAASSTV